MTTQQNTCALYRALPKIDDLLGEDRLTEACQDAPRALVVEALRSVLDDMREAISRGELCQPATIDEVVEAALKEIAVRQAPRLKRVVNATGIVIHTNLGRSLLADEAVEAVAAVASSYNTLEYDVEAGERGSRHDHVEALLCEVTGAEAAMAVNNNAAAVMMAIACFARGRDALVSRGQLVEIGGSFRVPDIMAESGAHMVEVGTTNKTHLVDYERATTEQTGLYLKVHSSNYRVMGFTSEVSLVDLVKLGDARGIPVLEDQGSGVLVDLTHYGLPYEPTVQASVAAGATLVSFSGDKLLGGPQAGIIVGRADAIARLKKHPMARALRLDKMTLAALEATLRLYRDEERAVREIPTLRALTMSVEETAERVDELMKQLTSASLAADFAAVDDVARAGGGSLPLTAIPSTVLAITPNKISVEELERALRLDGPVPIIARIHENRLVIDTRTFVHDDADVVIAALRAALSL